MSRLIGCLAVALVMIAVASPVASYGAKGHGALGRHLVDRYLSDLRRHDRADLRRFLSPAFQVQRHQGRQTRAQLLRDLPRIVSYRIRGVRATAVRDVLVVTFRAAANEVIGGHRLRTGYSPRLAAFIKGDRGWQIVAYANLNRPG